jgi:hypothetical protein
MRSAFLKVFAPRDKELEDRISETEAFALEEMAETEATIMTIVKTKTLLPNMKALADNDRIKPA